jgi:hypothetical protein
LILFAAFRLALLFRSPRLYSIDITSRGIAQPEAPSAPSLTWDRVTRMTPALWGGFWLSDEDRSRTIRVWSENPRFIELLHLVLERGAIAPPPLPFVVTVPRWVTMARLAMLAVGVALLCAYFVANGPKRLFWICSLAFAWVGYADWRKQRRAPNRVEIGSGAITVSSRVGDTVVQWAAVADVRLIAGRRGLSTLVVHRDGRTMEVPSLRYCEAFRVYHAARLRRGSVTEATTTPASTAEFAASQRRQLIAALVGGAIAGLASAGARYCGPAVRRRH